MRRLARSRLILILFAAALSAAHAGATSFDILTYNIYYGGGDNDPVFGRNGEWLDLIESRNPDVILLQETNGWLPSEENRIAAVVESLNAAFPADPPYTGHVGAASSGFHLALLTRFPVTLFETFTSVPVNSDTVSLHHAFIHGTLDVEGETIHIFGVHFKSGDHRVEREWEARALVALLEEIPPWEKVWVGGDFNSYSPVDIEPGSPTEPDYSGGASPASVKGWEPIEVLLDRGFEDVFRGAHPVDPGYTQNTADFLPPPAMGPVQRVDFLLRLPGNQWFLDSTETANDSLGGIASDHYAVCASFTKVMPTGVSAVEGRRETRLFAAPNPAAGAVRIEYALRRHGPVRVALYSPAGRMVRSIVDGERAAGLHETEWDGAGNGGRLLPPGVYFLRLETDLGADVVRLVRTGAVR